jgi:hypothetical protein
VKKLNLKLWNKYLWIIRTLSLRIGRIKKNNGVILLKMWRKKNQKKGNEWFTWPRERDEENPKTPTLLLLLFLPMIEGMLLAGIIKLACIFSQSKIAWTKKIIFFFLLLLLSFLRSFEGFSKDEWILSLILLSALAVSQWV